MKLMPLLLVLSSLYLIDKMYLPQYRIGLLSKAQAQDIMPVKAPRYYVATVNGKAKLYKEVTK